MIIPAILPIALHKGELDSVEKRQKVAQVFSRETGNQLDASVIHTWHRNQKKRSRMGSQLVRSHWMIGFVRMMK